MALELVGALFDNGDLDGHDGRSFGLEGNGVDTTHWKTMGLVGLCKS